MEIRPFPPTDFLDQSENEKTIRLIPAPRIKSMGYSKLSYNRWTTSQP